MEHIFIPPHAGNKKGRLPAQAERRRCLTPVLYRKQGRLSSWSSARAPARDRTGRVPAQGPVAGQGGKIPLGYARRDFMSRFTQSGRSEQLKIPERPLRRDFIAPWRQPPHPLISPAGGEPQGFPTGRRGQGVGLYKADSPAGGMGFAQAGLTHQPPLSIINRQQLSQRWS